MSQHHKSLVGDEEDLRRYDKLSDPAKPSERKKRRRRRQRRREELEEDALVQWCVSAGRFSLRLSCHAALVVRNVLEGIFLCRYGPLRFAALIVASCVKELCKGFWRCICAPVELFVRCILLPYSILVCMLKLARCIHSTVRERACTMGFWSNILVVFAIVQAVITLALIFTIPPVSMDGNPHFHLTKTFSKHTLDINGDGHISVDEVIREAQELEELGAHARQKDAASVLELPGNLADLLDRNHDGFISHMELEEFAKQQHLAPDNLRVTVDKLLAMPKEKDTGLLFLGDGLWETATDTYHKAAEYVGHLKEDATKEIEEMAKNIDFFKSKNVDVPMEEEPLPKPVQQIAAEQAAAKPMQPVRKTLRENAADGPEPGLMQAAQDALATIMGISSDPGYSSSSQETSGAKSGGSSGSPQARLLPPAEPVKRSIQPMESPGHPSPRAAGQEPPEPRVAPEAPMQTNVKAVLQNVPVAPKPVEPELPPPPAAAVEVARGFQGQQNPLLGEKPLLPPVGSQGDDQQLQNAKPAAPKPPQGVADIQALAAKIKAETAQALLQQPPAVVKQADSLQNVVPVVSAQSQTTYDSTTEDTTIHLPAAGDEHPATITIPGRVVKDSSSSVTEAQSVGTNSGLAPNSIKYNQHALEGAMRIRVVSSLQNRLRQVLGAQYVLTSVMKKPLHVVWRLDKYCQTHFLDLFQPLPEVTFASKGQADIEPYKGSFSKVVNQYLSHDPGMDPGGWFLDQATGTWEPPEPLTWSKLSDRMYTFLKPSTVIAKEVDRFVYTHALDEVGISVLLARDECLTEDPSNEYTSDEEFFEWIDKVDERLRGYWTGLGEEHDYVKIFVGTDSPQVDIPKYQARYGENRVVYVDRKENRVTSKFPEALELGPVMDMFIMTRTLEFKGMKCKKRDPHFTGLTFQMWKINHGRRQTCGPSTADSFCCGTMRECRAKD